jgi:LmbE family N-acetylglucosaminyl deacetylase
MLGIDFRLEPGAAPQLLCLGAHSDDIEIGCGGTVLRLLELVPDLAVDWVVLSAHGERRVEAERAAERFLSGAARSRTHLESFRERFFPFQPELKEYFDQLGRTVSPDIVFCPRGVDRHQDHRTVADLVENTFRDHLVLQYEIPKYDADLGQPNVFVRLSQEIVDRKIELLFESFPSQHDRYWFTENTFRGLMSIRGVECRAPYAEGFDGRKMVLA